MIGIAIAVNLVIMGGLVVTLVARRRSRLATPDGIVEPAPYRYGAMTTTRRPPPAPISFMATTRGRLRPSSEDFDDDVSATEPADYRRFRPVMSDEGERVETTIESFLTGGSTAPATGSSRRRATGAGRPSRPARPGPGRVDPTPAAAAPATGPSRLDWEIRLRDEEAR